MLNSLAYTRLICYLNNEIVERSSCLKVQTSVPYNISTFDFVIMKCRVHFSHRPILILPLMAIKVPVSGHVPLSQ